ncbi:MAG: aldehyde dehydrogenase family protein, partial [Alphaproteobacteria bacterium]|nr:aldehyde dehydrogenase family protein [Alphaproteobacteria bacterium]
MIEEQIFIGGRWRGNGATLPVEDPSTGEPIGTLAAGGAADVDAAVIAADTALHGAWGKATAAERGRVLARMG